MADEFMYENSNMATESTPDANKLDDNKSSESQTLLGERQRPQPNPSDVNKPAFIDSTPPEVREARAVAEYNPYLKTQIDEAGKHVSSIADGADHDPLDKEAAALHEANTRELGTILIADMGGSPNDAQLLASEVTRYGQLSEDERAAEASTVLDTLKRNRPDTWQNDLKLARAFVARDPRVFKFLQETGLGNSYALTQRIIELARAAAVRGPNKK